VVLEYRETSSGVSLIVARLCLYRQFLVVYDQRMTCPVATTGGRVIFTPEDAQRAGVLLSIHTQVSGNIPSSSSNLPSASATARSQRRHTKTISPLTTSPLFKTTPCTLFPSFSNPTTSHPPLTTPPSLTTIPRPTFVALAASAQPPTGFAYPSLPFNGPILISFGAKALMDSGVGVNVAAMLFAFRFL
jgi:hypothetical protein